MGTLRFTAFFALCINLSFNLSAQNDISDRQLKQNLQRYQQKIESLKMNIDNSVFNSEDILLNMDFDPHALLQFFQENIIYQPYEGLLKGIQGTLNARAGNSLDQSVTLAKMLNDAGYETRIAKADLNDDQAHKLLSGFKKATLPKHIGQGDAFESIVASLSTGSEHQSINWQNSHTAKRYKKTLLSLMKRFKEHEFNFKEKDVSQLLLESGRKYFWLEYRLGPSDSWKTAHPALATTIDIDIKPQSYFTSNVPKKYLHQVKIEAFIEQKVGDQFKTHALMLPWQKPTANLQDVLLTFSNVPSGVNLQSDFNLTEILNKASFFKPMFNGQPAGKYVIDTKGRLIDAEAMSSQMGGLFQTIGDKALMAVDKVKNDDQQQSHLELNAQWLQITFIQPNGQKFIQKRYLYHKKNKQNELDTKMALMSEYSMLVNAGSKPNSYLAKVYLDLVESGLPLLKASTQKVFQQQDNVKFPTTIKRSEFELLAQYHWMDHHPFLEEEVIKFRNQGNMLAFKRGYVNSETAFVAVDIINNKQQFIRKKDEKYFVDTESAFRQGVWETASEWLPAKLLKIKGQVIDTLVVSENADDQSIKWKLLKADDSVENKLSQIKHKNPQLVKALLSDFNQGYWVIIPEDVPQNVLMTGWWRFNPETGETLGMTADGGGQSATEYAIELAGQALFLVRAIGNLKKCDEKTNNLEKMCCLAEAHFNNVLGLSFGSALGASVGTAGAAIFDIVDFTTELATGTGIAPSTNGKLCAGINFPDF